MSERQLETELKKIRADHIERYEYAAKIVSGNVIDAACGCGYGSAIIAKECQNLNHITGFDIDAETIDFANQHWKHPKNTFIVQDVTQLSLTGKFDWVVSFETIEHLQDPVPFLKATARLTKKLLCSVPNQDSIPYSLARFPYHHRHYTAKEISDLLQECGFKVTKLQYQYDKKARGFNNATGRSIILECESI